MTPDTWHVLAAASLEKEAEEGRRRRQPIAGVDHLPSLERGGRHIAEAWMRGIRMALADRDR